MPSDKELRVVALANEIEKLKGENYRLYERVCSAENKLSDNNKYIQRLRNVIASHKDRLTVASIDLEDELIEANLGVGLKEALGER